MQVNKILIPNKPQFDVITALWLIANYGQDRFPGVNDAMIEFWNEARDPSNDEISRFRAEGALLVDISGSVFDHHDDLNGRHETAASLVASYLGIEHNPELSALLNYVREDDLEGLHNKYGDLVYIIKSMYKQNIAPNEVVKYAMQVLTVLQAGQLEWHVNVKREFEAKVKILKVRRYKRRMNVGIIESDNIQVSNYGITVGNLSVVMQQRSTGHVMIFTNKNHRIDLREIIAAIRKRELELAGHNGDIRPEKLMFEGKSAMVPNWYYHRSLNAFLNGSDALHQTEPTKVPFREINRFVLYGLTTDESELCDCADGGTNCPYAAYGFSKCSDKKIK